jgi:hypothetical protein
MAKISDYSIESMTYVYSRKCKGFLHFLDDQGHVVGMGQEVSDRCNELVIDATSYEQLRLSHETVTNPDTTPGGMTGLGGVLTYGVAGVDEGGVSGTLGPKTHAGTGLN